MRKVGVLLLLIAAASVGAAKAALPDRPTLRIVDRTPLVVRGAGFETQERVRVILIAERRSSQVVRASQTGAFVARFNHVLGRCARFSLQAFGSSGSRARLLPARIAIDCTPND